MTLRELIDVELMDVELRDVAEQDTLFRVYDGVCPEPFVFRCKDYKQCFDSIREPLEPLLDRKVQVVRPDSTADPLCPRKLMPTIWVILEDKE